MSSERYDRNRQVGRYTFQKCVVGMSNQVAYDAAVEVYRCAGGLRKPLYLYATIGSGKTHILHVIGHAINSSMSSVRVLYLHSFEIINDNLYLYFCIYLI